MPSNNIKWKEQYYCLTLTHVIPAVSILCASELNNIRGTAISGTVKHGGEHFQSDNPS